MNTDHAAQLNAMAGITPGAQPTAQQLAHRMLIEAQYRLCHHDQNQPVHGAGARPYMTAGVALTALHRHSPGLASDVASTILDACDDPAELRTLLRDHIGAYGVQAITEVVHGDDPWGVPDGEQPWDSLHLRSPLADDAELAVLNTVLQILSTLGPDARIRGFHWLGDRLIHDRSKPAASQAGAAAVATRAAGSETADGAFTREPPF